MEETHTRAAAGGGGRRQTGAGCALGLNQKWGRRRSVEMSAFQSARDRRGLSARSGY